MSARLRTLLAAGLVVGASAVAVPTSASAAPSATECTGVLAPGTYRTVVVPEDEQCVSEGLLTIRGGVWIEPGATFVLGSEESPDTPSRISGGVHATDAANVQIHFTTINGGVEIHGGAGPFLGADAADGAFYQLAPFFCSDEQGPLLCLAYSTIEDNTIHGRVTVDGYDGFWFGFIRNTVSGTVNITNNDLVDPDGNEVVTNTVHGNLNCSGNSPAAQVGDSQGEANVVTGHATGECAPIL